ncbi:MAG: cupin domain-containing protein [Candidatus Omnitrophota bacterium]|nr:MAG: cupin domain-containing protein [Candidatus Omnitrophota bacterium]
MQNNKNNANRKDVRERVIPLANLVDYQDGAVVSRTVIKTKSGTVTPFAFDEGQALSEHVAPFDALAYILEGAVKIRIAGRPFEVQEGQMLVMPANKPHSLSATQQFKMLLVMIKK